MRVNNANYIMTQTVIQEAITFTLPKFKVQVVAKIYSDEDIRSFDAYYNSVVGDKWRNWEFVKELGERGILIVSDWITVDGETSVEDAVRRINPGFYPSNTTLAYNLSNV